MKKILRGIGMTVASLALCAAAWAGCPKLLMFDGIDIRKGALDEREARYWGETVGVDGFFVNRLMSMWQDDVGDDPDGPDWKMARQFQTLYARHGMTENFIKVALYKPHDWRSADENAAVVKHFAHAAALARWAGFKGIALDLEAYVDTWGGKAGGEELASTVQNEGKAIAQAMYQADPDLTLVIMQDAVYWAERDQGYHGGYRLAVPFLKGLLSVHWSKVVFATESTYGGDVDSPLQKAYSTWQRFIRENHLPVGSFSVAPGLWPLGRSYFDKSARQSPEAFGRSLQDAFKEAPDYVWIYGFGSAWQSDGSYGKGAATPNLPAYMQAIQQVKNLCFKKQ